jgi:hypothetical protein
MCVTTQEKQKARKRSPIFVASSDAQRQVFCQYAAENAAP